MQFVGFVVTRKGDIARHAKRHAPDSEYVFFFFGLRIDTFFVG